MKNIAIIGGTGIDELSKSISDKPTIIHTKYGPIEYCTITIGSDDVIFVPRHGNEHSQSPLFINYKGIISALKELGVDYTIGVCAVGSLNSNYDNGSFAVFEDFIDFTKKEITTFYDDPQGPFQHTDFSHPYNATISNALIESCIKTDVNHLKKAVYIGVNGPRYETPAEIRLFSSWGDVIGMTNVPETILAKEAGLSYGAIGIVTNLACGLTENKLDHDEVRNAMKSVSSNLFSILENTIKILRTID